jgi:CRISPR-associated protein Cmr2
VADLAGREASAQLDGLRRACQEIGLARVARGDLPCASAFQFDASVLLPNRWRSVFEEQDLDADPEEWGRRHVGAILRVLDEPYPYVACLVADGDRMGGAIESLTSADEHRAFSRSLAGFAGEARRTVEQVHRGSLVYTGGDDVLAFLPLPEALGCADALRRRFEAVMAAASAALPAGDRPTLSVGVGVGHIMESMGDLLALGREAEALAKGAAFRADNRDRNALAVVVDKRSGAKRSWRVRWDEWGGDPVRRLRSDIGVLEERLSSRKVFEIDRTLKRLPEPAGATDSGWGRVLALEVRRSLSRVHAGEGGVAPEEVGLSLNEQAGYAALRSEVSSWVQRMLVARTFAAAAPRLRGPAEGAAA